MLLCGFHWHSRYSIWDFYIYFINFTTILCGLQRFHVANKYQMWSDLMENGSFNHLLALHITFSAILG